MPEPQLPKCPICDKPMDAVLRRNEIVLMVCFECRVSATMPASEWEAGRSAMSPIPTVLPPPDNSGIL